MLQDVVLPGRGQVPFHSGPLGGHQGLLLLPVLRDTGAGRGQCQQGAGPVHEAWVGRIEQVVSRGAAVQRAPHLLARTPPPGPLHTVPPQEAQAVPVALLAHLPQHLRQGDGQTGAAGAETLCSAP